MACSSKSGATMPSRTDPRTMAGGEVSYTTPVEDTAVRKPALLTATTHANTMSPPTTLVRLRHTIDVASPTSVSGATSKDAGSARSKASGWDASPSASQLLGVPARDAAAVRQSCSSCEQLDSAADRPSAADTAWLVVVHRRHSRPSQGARAAPTR